MLKTCPRCGCLKGFEVKLNSHYPVGVEQVNHVCGCDYTIRMPVTKKKDGNSCATVAFEVWMARAHRKGKERVCIIKSETISSAIEAYRKLAELNGFHIWKKEMRLAIIGAVSNEIGWKMWYTVHRLDKLKRRKQ